MRQGDIQIGFPATDYTDTKANIEALAGVLIGASATAIDNSDAPFGRYDGTIWHWSNGDVGGATTELDNLTTTAINADLIFNDDAVERLITAQDQTVADTGGVEITFKGGKGKGTGDGGDVSNLGGDAEAGGNGDGGDLYYAGGQADGSGAGGDVEFESAPGGDTGNGGVVRFTSGAGGATSGNAGDIEFSLGSGDVNGKLRIIPLVNGFGEILDADSISAERTATFPDKDGTFAMLDDIFDFATPLNGWIPTAWAGLTRVSATVFTTTTDVSGIIGKGAKLKFTDTTTKYLVVLSATFGAGVTTITTIATTDYAFVGNPSAVYYSNVENPFGWPGSFNFTLTPTGFSANPTATATKFSVRNNKITINYIQNALGTSNANTFTMTGLPVAIATAVVLFPTACFGADNGVNIRESVLGSPLPLRVDISGTTISLGIDANSLTSWTATATAKGVYAMDFSYEY